jgi:hypothetical protein
LEIELATTAGIVRELRRRNLRFVFVSLVADEGVLWLASNLREKSIIPRVVIFRLSVFAGRAMYAPWNRPA